MMQSTEINIKPLRNKQTHRKILLCKKVDWEELKNHISEFGKSLSHTFEPGHEKMCLMSYANNKGADQPAHPRSLISAFVVRCLDSIISLESTAEISRL